MSIVRWGEQETRGNGGPESQVYITKEDRDDGERGYHCNGCSLENETFFTSKDSLKKHLYKHREEGYSVPDFIFERIEKDGKVDNV
jgi:hypothetical protein